MVAMVSSGSAGPKENLQKPALTENPAMNQPRPTASRREFLPPRSHGFPRRGQGPVHLHIRAFSRRAAVAIPAFFMALAGYAPLLLAQSLDFAPPKPQGPAKIQSSLWDLATEGNVAPKPVERDGSRDRPGGVVVTLVPYPGKGSSSIDPSSFAELGIEVLARSNSLLRVSAPGHSLPALSRLAGVGFVREPFQPILRSTISEGAARIGARVKHREDVRGKGARVAIIDAGFKGADRLGRDMPESWRYRDFTGKGIYAGDDHSRHRHGTACAEIVHDVAPDAELALLKVGDLVDLENAREYCTREGIGIVSHSLGWMGTGFGDGRGLACEIVDAAAERGILWVNAAGNEARSHYTGVWSDRDSDGWHDFSRDDEVLTVQAAAGDSIQVMLTWNDFPATAQNYDLFLYFMDKSENPKEVGRSVTRQNGFGADPPVEWIKYVVEESGEYGIAVGKADGALSKRLKIWSYNQEIDEYAVARNSMGIPADARGGMSVGAVNHREWSAEKVEYYSSRGPTTDGRIKPDLVAPTRVSTVSYGPGSYAGTSASAPHVAGAAALIKSANPSYSGADLWEALVEAAVDIEGYGRDNNSGYGKLVLAQSIEPQITSADPAKVRYNQVLTLRGTGFGEDRREGRVIFHQAGEPGPSHYVSWSDTLIEVRVPAGARRGDLQVETVGGSAAVPVKITSPWVRSISPASGRTGTLVTVYGENFGFSRKNGRVSIGSAAISSFPTWSITTIRFRIPLNARSGELRVRTPEGTSNAVTLEVTSPYLGRVSPGRVKPGDRLTLTGSNFGKVRGAGYVLLWPDVRPSTGDYVTWSEGRIVVEVPDRAASGDVRVVTDQGSSGSRRIEVEAGELGPFVGQEAAGDSGFGRPFPAPFNAAVTIPFSVSVSGPVRISVHNLMGQRVRVLRDGWSQAGAHQVRWDGRSDSGAEAASGVYWALLRTGGTARSTRLLLIR